MDFIENINRAKDKILNDTKRAYTDKATAMTPETYKLLKNIEENKMENLDNEIILNNKEIASFIFDEFEFSIEYNKQDNQWIAIPYDADKYDYIIVIEGNIKDDIAVNEITFDDAGVMLFNSYILTKEKFNELKEISLTI